MPRYGSDTNITLPNYVKKRNLFFLTFMAKMMILPSDTMLRNSAIASSSCGEYVSNVRCVITLPLA